MSPTLEEAICAAGWSPHRQVDTTEWYAMLKEDGFELIPEAEEIMAAFGGLTIRTVETPNRLFSAPEAYFDSKMPGGTGDVSRILAWQERLNIKMNPIAELSRGHAVLVISDQGSVYCLFDSLIYLYGTSFDDALENTIVFGKRCPRVIGDLQNE